MSRIAYVASHHGRGHVTRAAAVLAHVRAPSALFSTADPPELPPGVRFVRLPDDAPRAPADALPAGPFHYAPVGHDGLRRRMARLAAWAAEGPGVLVADVSAEVVALGRLLSLPTVAVRQSGARWDEAHLAAYRLATRLVAPFSPALDEPDAPDWVRAKTDYAGGFSRFDGRARLDPEPRTVAVLCGRGGTGAGSAAAFTPHDVARAVAATPEWRWTLVGAAAPPGAPANLTGVAWADDPFPILARADVVVAHGGHNAVMECAAAGRPLVVVPAPRPFGEQARKAEALARVGAALAAPRWPEPAAWPALLAHAREQPTAALRLLVDGRGGARAAAVLDRLARAR